MHTCLLLTLCTLEYTDFDLKNRSISSFIAIGKSQSKFLEKKENFIELIPTIIFNKRIIYFLSIYLSIYLYIYILPPSLFHNLFFSTLQITFSSPSPPLAEQTQLRTRKNGAKDNRFQIAPLRTERYYVEIGKR